MHGQVLVGHARIELAAGDFRGRRPSNEHMARIVSVGGLTQRGQHNAGKIRITQEADHTLRGKEDGMCNRSQQWASYQILRPAHPVDP